VRYRSESAIHRKKNRVAQAFINAIGTAVPDHDIHQAFIGWALDKIPDPRQRKLFERMVGRSGIEHRWSVLPRAPGGGDPTEPGGFYHGDTLPSTAPRMRLYGEVAPALALKAIGNPTSIRKRSPISSSPAAPASSRRASISCSPSGSASAARSSAP
jgi:hypothetical protein